MGAFVVRSERLKGARLGAYQIVRLIGHGATASVFEGAHVALGKPVAIKVLHEHLADDAQVRGRFLREGKVAARLRHPNIVDALDVGVEGPIPYLVMELLTGVDLRTHLADARILPLPRALALLLPVASGLAHAHDVGVIHRDLKPANVFLARDLRDDVVPKLVDFGLSKATLGEATSSLTATELVAGTALYMAPEQTLGVKYSSPASDQYSLAAILYEAVTGQPLFAPDVAHVLFDRIRNEAVGRPSRVAPALTEAFDEILLRALSRVPARRFPSVRAFGAALLPVADAKTAAAVQRDFAERRAAPIRGEAPSEPRRSVTVRKASAAEESRPGARTESMARSSSHAVGKPDAPLPCAPGESPFHIKGMPYRGFVRLVEKAVPGGLDAFSKGLSDQRLAGFLHQPFLATGRYDALPFVPLFAALARLTGSPFEEMVRMTSFGQCRYDAKTVFKLLFSSDDVQSVADRFHRFNAQYYDFGKFQGTVLGPRHIALEVGEAPAYLFPWLGPMHVAYAEEAIRLVGGKGVRTLSQAVQRDGKRGKFSLVSSRSELAWEA